VPSDAVDFPDFFHVIPSPGLFRVESASSDLDQEQSHFAIFTVGIILSSSEPTRLPGGHVWPRDRSGRATEKDLVDAAERKWARIDA